MMKLLVYLKSGFQRVICSLMFTAALFRIVDTEKELKYLAIDEWMQKLQYICTI
jgi:hypothetical protein